MKKQHPFGHTQRIRQSVAAACAVLLAGVTLSSATILSLDVGSGPVQSGFSAFNTTPSQTFGAITVTETGADGLYDRTYGGGSALANVYRDFLYNNSFTPINIRLDGLIANDTYTMRLYSYDFEGQNFNTTVQFTPTIGSGSSATITYNGSIAPASDYDASTVVAWTADGAGTLAFNVTPIAGLSPRLNGLELLSSIPEPTAALLLGVSGLLLWRARRHGRQ